MKKLFAFAVTTAFVLLLSSFEQPAALIKAKQIEKQFVPINERVLLGKYEVSNLEYRSFLNYLLQDKQHALYERCMLDTVRWESYNGQDELREKYHSFKAFEGYPVVTVSYESANAYCQWLTTVYHADEGRKFKKVVFRLPSEQEWTDAANGGMKNKMYPWGNFYLRDNKGQYLCNFLHLGDQSITFDQQTKTYKIVEQFLGYYNRAVPLSPVSQFPPSPAGLYNLSGNAAEMVAEKGLAKGGSFNDPGYDVTIGSKKHYNTASPEIGFRVLMEILEK